MKAKHTPGPWIAALNSLYMDITNVDKSDRNLVASSFLFGGGVEILHKSDENKANAILMASAPEMLEMLQEISDTFDRDQHLLNVSPTKIKELIKKATTI